MKIRIEIDVESYHDLSTFGPVLWALSAMANAKPQATDEPRPVTGKQIADSLKDGSGRLVSAVRESTREGTRVETPAPEGRGVSSPAPASLDFPGQESPREGASKDGAPQTESAARGAAAPPPEEPKEREPGEDDGPGGDDATVFFRCRTVKDVVRVFVVDRKILRKADVVERVRGLQGEGIPCLDAISEDQLEDRIAASMVALGVPEEA